MTDKKKAEVAQLRSPISEEEKLLNRSRLKYRVFAALRKTFDRLKKERGLTQDEIARFLGADKGLISKRLSGQRNLTLDTVADLARAMEVKVDVNFIPYEDLLSNTLTETRPNDSTICNVAMPRPFAQTSAYMAVSEHKAIFRALEQISDRTLFCRDPVTFAQKSLGRTTLAARSELANANKAAKASIQNHVFNDDRTYVTSQ